MRTILVIASVLVIKILEAQNYSVIPIKEEFDLYNQNRVFNGNSAYKPSTADPNSDGGTFGDGMAKILKGYITMYKTTKNKAYLYKCI